MWNQPALQGEPGHPGKCDGGGQNVPVGLAELSAYMQDHQNPRQVMLSQGPHCHAPIPFAWQCPFLTPAQCRSFLNQPNSRDKTSILKPLHLGSHCNVGAGVCSSGMSPRIWVQMGACPHLSRMTSEYLALDKHSQESRTVARWHQRSHLGCSSCPHMHPWTWGCSWAGMFRAVFCSPKVFSVAC